MKKIFMIMALFLATVAGYSEEAQVTNSNRLEFFLKEQTIEMYDFTNFNILDSKYKLYFNEEEKEIVTNIMKEFEKEMKDSFYSKKRKKRAWKALNKNTQNMCDTLSYYKYRRYLFVLNSEIIRRGIDLY